MSHTPSTDDLIARAKAALSIGSYGAALEHLDRAGRKAPSYADVQNLRGRCLAALDRLEEALSAFDAALEINGGYVEAHVNRALVLRRLGREKEADETLARAGKVAETADGTRYPPDLAGTFANLHRELGDAYAGSGFHMEAAEQYRRASELRPSFADIRNRLARTLIELGILEAAVRESRAALEINPLYAEARANLGLALFHKGEMQAARSEWERCVRENPQDTTVQDYLSFLEDQAAGLGDEGVPAAGASHGRASSPPAEPRRAAG